MNKNIKIILLVALALLPALGLSQTKIKTSGITDGAVTTAKLAGDSVTAGKIVDGAVGTAEIDTDAVTADEIAAGAVGTDEIADGTVAAADLAATLDLSGKTLTLPTANTPAFTKSYTSANQTITAAGTLTLAHGLGGMPTMIQVRLKCLTAELGYSVGDEVMIDFFGGYQGGNTGQALSIVPDATNLNIRYGGAANVFGLPNKATGIIANATNASWAMIVRAWR